MYNMPCIKSFSKVLLSSLLISLTVYCQSNLESGSKPTMNYWDYNAYPQNWAITQNEQGIMYFGNGIGLLEFDGNTWRLYQVPNKTAIRSLANGDDGKIYAGAQNELGYFLPDSLGRLTFHSLLNFLPKDKRDFTDVWNTYFINGNVYFGTFNYIFIWNIQKREFNIIPSGNKFHLMFYVNGTIYEREWGKGLEVLKDDSLAPVIGGEKFANEKISVMLPFPGEKGTILIGTQTMGLFKYDGQKFIPFKTEADNFLKGNLIYRPGTILSDGNILLGTQNGGAVIIDTNGKEVQKYDKESGIHNNQIYYTFQDRSGAIWLATNNGISRIDYASPVSFFQSKNNLSTVVNKIIRYKGIIYAATPGGIYSLNPKTSMFHLLTNGKTEVWPLLEFKDELLAGTSNGLFKVEDDNLMPIRKTTGNSYIVYALKQSALNPNRIFVGTQSGLWSVLKSGNKWIDEGQLMDYGGQKSSLEEDNENRIWMSTWSSGLFRITFQNDDKGDVILKNPQIEHFDKTNGLQDGYLEIQKVNGINYFVTTDSIYKFDESKKLFYTDSSDQIMSEIYKLAHNILWIGFNQDELGRIWIEVKNKIEMGTLQPNGSYKWISAPFNSLADQGIWRVYSEKNEVTWFATGWGIIKYDFRKKNLGSTNYSALVRSVRIGEDSTIFFGGNTDHLIVPEIAFKYNAVKFRYSATSYERENTNKFKTFLDGFDKGWSSWSTETKKEYTNLPPGKYTFKVAALNILGNESSTGTYSFEILPPWYRTWWAYSIYVVFLGLIVLAVDRIQRKRLLAKERERTENEKKLKELEHAKEIEKAYTELKSTQAQLIHAEKMASLGELTAGIAHEIKNPLNFINNFSEVSRELLDEMRIEIKNNNIEEVINLVENLKQNLDKINQHGKRADSIVKGMLLHSRGTSGEKTLTDINDLLDQYVNLAYHGMRATNKEFNITIKKDYDETLEKINVVPQDISRVFLNLINNACYAAYDRKKSSDNNFTPTLKVSTKNLKGKIEISISDNGSGIPKDILDKIFQPFFTTKPTGEGTGLGLSLSYDIVVKQHGGELKVETKDGEGSEFVIILPND